MMDRTREQTFSFTLSELRDVFRANDRMTYTHSLRPGRDEYTRSLEVTVQMGPTITDDRVTFRIIANGTKIMREVTYPVYALFNLMESVDMILQKEVQKEQPK